MSTEMITMKPQATKVTVRSTDVIGAACPKASLLPLQPVSRQWLQSETYVLASAVAGGIQAAGVPAGAAQVSGAVAHEGRPNGIDASGNERPGFAGSLMARGIRGNRPWRERT